MNILTTAFDKNISNNVLINCTIDYKCKFTVLWAMLLNQIALKIKYRIKCKHR